MLKRTEYIGFILGIVGAIIGGIAITGANYFFLTNQPVPISKFLTFTFYLTIIGVVVIVIFGYFGRHFYKD